MAMMPGVFLFLSLIFGVPYYGLRAIKDKFVAWLNQADEGTRRVKKEKFSLRMDVEMILELFGFKEEGKTGLAFPSRNDPRRRTVVSFGVWLVLFIALFLVSPPSASSWAEALGTALYCSIVNAALLCIPFRPTGLFGAGVRKGRGRENVALATNEISVRKK